MNAPDRILLVSGSPRRRELLQLIGVGLDMLNADIDESRLEGEDPVEYATRLAREKALTGLAADGERRPALGADTIVLVDEEIFGKPVSSGDAHRMLRRLSGRAHEVLTAVAVAVSPDTVYQALNRTRVEFGEIPESWIEGYAASEEPMDKAGAYAVQGRAGQWVRRIDGSYSGVMGLPLYETAALLRRAGFPFSVF